MNNLIDQTPCVPIGKKKITGAHLSILDSKNFFSKIGQNKRVLVLGVLILILVGILVAKNFLLKDRKFNTDFLSIQDSSGEIQEIIKRSHFMVLGNQGDQAVALLNETLRKYPNNQDILIQLAIVHRKTKLYSESEKIYQQLIQTYPDCIECLNNYGVQLLMQGNPERAIEILNLVQQKKPDYPEPYFNIAVAYEKSGQIKNASVSYQRYLELVPLNDSRQEPAMARERIRRLQEGL